jgi:TonB family protein
MGPLKASAANVACAILIVFTVSSVILITFPSCGRSKTSLAGLEKINPPPLPPAPQKLPSMTGSDTTWDMVNQIPMFPGGAELLGRHISRNINYPAAAREKGIQGRVVVKFLITSKGVMNSYQIYKSVSPELDSEALRVIKTITRFEPAIIEGKPVSAWYYLPVNFRLN